MIQTNPTQPAKPSKAQKSPSQCVQAYRVGRVSDQAKSIAAVSPKTGVKSSAAGPAMSFAAAPSRVPSSSQTISQARLVTRAAGQSHSPRVQVRGCFRHASRGVPSSVGPSAANNKEMATIRSKSIRQWILPVSSTKRIDQALTAPPHASNSQSIQVVRREIICGSAANRLLQVSANSPIVQANL